MPSPQTFDEWMRLFTLVITPFGVIISFLWGVYQWRQSREATFQQALLESKKPFLNRQLELYGEATKVAAKLAVSQDNGERQRLEARFWELYWGELGLVENSEVEKAMVDFGEALRRHNLEQLKDLSLDLAHAIRRSLDKSWETRAWTNRE